MLAVTPAASSTRGSSCSQHRRLSRMSSSQRQTSNIFDLDHHHVHQVHFLARPIGCVARHQLCTRLTLRHAGVGMKPRLQLASTFVPSLSMQGKDTRHLDIAEQHPRSCCCRHPPPQTHSQASTASRATPTSSGFCCTVLRERASPPSSRPSRCTRSATSSTFPSRGSRPTRCARGVRRKRSAKVHVHYLR